jgi:hypothetical protein
LSSVRFHRASIARDGGLLLLAARVGFAGSGRTLPTGTCFKSLQRSRPQATHNDEGDKAHADTRLIAELGKRLVIPLFV